MLLLSACSDTPVVAPRVELVQADRLRMGVYPDDPLASDNAGKAAGALHDLSVELGRELARRLGVTFEAVLFESQPPALEAVSAGKVDVMIVNATPPASGPCRLQSRAPAN